MKTVFSGIQPTGKVHLGNLLGAINNWVHLSNEENKNYFCVVDLHSLTTHPDPSLMQENINETIKVLISSGINQKNSNIYIQSNVPEHVQLSWILSNFCQIGELQRMTQFKEKAGKDRDGAFVGLYTYPVLQAADILAYKATDVPVGEDQKQHIELCRDIAQAFNSMFEIDFFPLPEARIQKAAARIMSLRDGRKKMSKSDPSDYSRINMTDGPDAIAQKIKKAKTDPYPLPDSLDELDKRPEAQNLITIFAALSERSEESVLSEFAGKGFGDFKKYLAELAVEIMGPIGKEMQRLMNYPDEVDSILNHGANKAREIANPIVSEAKEIVGFLKP